MKETERIGSLKGIGEKTEKLFQKVGVETAITREPLRSSRSLFLWEMWRKGK